MACGDQYSEGRQQKLEMAAHLLVHDHPLIVPQVLPVHDMCSKVGQSEQMEHTWRSQVDSEGVVQGEEERQSLSAG